MDTLEESELGVMVGNICVTADGVADDVYAMTDNPIKLKAIISLLENYSRKYRVPFGKGKTKIVVTGSLVDIQHYKDIKMWTMDGEDVLIVDENEHLGRVVTGFGEEERNVMENISRGRKSLYSLLGPAFSHKCDLNPAVQIHLFRLFTCCIVRSGISALAVRPTQAKPLH